MSHISSTKLLKELLKNYFQGFFPSSDEKPLVAWCTSVGPAEILIAMGFQVYYPENHGALLGATRQSEKFIPLANRKGYSPEICSYLTSDIGSYIEKETPLTRAYGIPHVPHPHVLVYNTNQCREVQDWFSYYSKEFKVPSLGIYSPWKIDLLDKSYIRLVEEQLKSLVSQLEGITRNKLDQEKLYQTLSLSQETSQLWKKFLKYAQSHPTPITFFDSCIQMAPAVILRGLKEAVNYYKLLNQEIEVKVAQKEGAIRKEKNRLYWDGMPVWGRLRFLSELFEKLNTSVVASTYCDSWIFDSFDPQKPFESMAEAYTQIFINRSERSKEEILNKQLNFYKADGIIFHDAKTCPYNSNTRFGLPQRLNVPYLIIDGDVNDLRCFSDEQTLTAIEAFVDQFQ